MRSKVRGRTRGGRCGGAGAALLGVMVAAAVVGGPAGAEAQEQPAQPPGFPCQDDEMFHEFDFWVGHWDVFANGRKAGENRIEKMVGGCLLLESWTNVAGREGKSFNWIDRSTYDRPRWRQLWVNDQGNTLDYYEGHLEDGAMHFSGHTLSPDGEKILQKLIFTPIHGDTVRQVFERSKECASYCTSLR